MINEKGLLVYLSFDSKGRLKLTEIELLSKKYDDKVAYECTHLSKTKKKQIINDFTKFSNDFLQKEYGLTLDIPIILTQRFKSRLAELLTYFLPDDKIEKQEIVFSERYIAGSRYDPDREGSKHSTQNVLKHELVHYALFRLGKNYHDGEDDFEKELARLAIASSGTTANKHNYFNQNKLVCYSILDEYLLPGKPVRLWHTIDPIYINRDKIIVVKSY
jgi:hypothetical protein